MKNTNIFFILICLFAAFFLVSCEKSDLQKTTPKEEVSLNERTEDCDYCPVPDCCCSIELIDGDFVRLEFCGTTNPKESTTVCGPIETVETDCDFEINGFYWTFDLTEGVYTKQVFCAALNSSFMIKAILGGGQVRITCQEGVTPPQNITPILAFPGKYFFNVNNACEIGPCG